MLTLPPLSILSCWLLKVPSPKRMIILSTLLIILAWPLPLITLHTFALLATCPWWWCYEVFVTLRQLEAIQYLMRGSLPLI